MRKLPFFIILIMSVVVASCDKAPGYVVGESDMVPLLVDIHKAEALIEQNPEKYGNDSIRKSIKSSVLMKHGVTPEKFDTSLVWYAHNMDVYNDVYSRVTEKLEAEKAMLESGGTSAAVTRKRSSRGPRYRDYGDTADIWKEARQYVVTASLCKDMVPFVYVSNSESAPGDRYAMRMKVVTSRSSAAVETVVAIEYVDGVVTLTQRKASSDGWNEFVLQGDSLKRIRNVFGYISFNVTDPRSICYVDSVMLLRTHFDRQNYGYITTQKVLDRYHHDKVTTATATGNATSVKVDEELVIEDKPAVGNAHIAPPEQRGPRPRPMRAVRPARPLRLHTK